MTLKNESLPWRDRPYLSVRDSADLIACSPSWIYELAKIGKLELVRVLPNLTAVRTEGVALLVDAAKPWTPAGHVKVTSRLDKQHFEATDELSRRGDEAQRRPRSSIFKALEDPEDRISDRTAQFFSRLASTPRRQGLWTHVPPSIRLSHPRTR